MKVRATHGLSEAADRLTANRQDNRFLKALVVQGYLMRKSAAAIVKYSRSS